MYTTRLKTSPLGVQAVRVGVFGNTMSAFAHCYSGIPAGWVVVFMYFVYDSCNSLHERVKTTHQTGALATWRLFTLCVEVGIPVLLCIFLLLLFRCLGVFLSDCYSPLSAWPMGIAKTAKWTSTQRNNEKKKNNWKNAETNSGGCKKKRQSTDPGNAPVPQDKASSFSPHSPAFSGLFQPNQT